ncbi:cold shock protein (beta-ribbon, CspA family) [Marinospirillum celere]|uniref:Cold shock protein (Beta-ribbon, CspA family) n=1 Tax=Marinospirillum celere TaxID=1122252 RepID=A0A1I1HCQ9_9GAMM|nr:cold shock domain-containing protein [Marinospirillum celere]SFC19263.1 cold shock protein (beta-ribbon, CspA family) [Marinospirillum celere]
MLNNTLLRNILVSLVVAIIAPLVLPLLAVSPEGADAGSAAAKTYLLVFVLLMVAASINEFLRLKVAGVDADDLDQGSDDDMDDDREEGVVKWFNVNKGFGFIIRDVGGEVFVHFRSIRGTGHRTLREGQRVRFAAVEGEKGLQAEDVSVLNR